MFSKTKLSIPKTTWAYIGILGVLVVGAIMREINLLIILAGMMCGPLLISWQMIRTNLKQVKLRRQLPKGVSCGQSFEVRYAVSNCRKHIDSWAIVVNDRIRNVTAATQSIDAERASCFVTHVPVGETRPASFQARFMTRGRYRFGPLRISTRVPVGLLQGRASAKSFDDLLVYPRLGFLTRGWKDLVQFEEQGQRNSQRQQGPTEGDFFGLREWRAGDCRGWIHWRSSAKRNELVVRQFEQRRNQDLVLLLDLNGANAAPLRHASLQDLSPPNAHVSPSEQNAEESAAAVEAAISFTATAIAEHCRRGAGQLTLRLAGQTGHQLRGPAGPGLLNDAMELLAEITPSADDRSPFELFGSLPSLQRDDHVVLIRPGAVDPSRWCSDDPAANDQLKVAGAIAINTQDERFAQLFSWTDPDDLPQTKLRSFPSSFSSTSSTGSSRVPPPASRSRQESPSP